MPNDVTPRTPVRRPAPGWLTKGRLTKGVLGLAIAGATVAAPVGVILAGPAPDAGALTVPVDTYLPGTPSLTTITSPAGCVDAGCAPWNTSQGTSSATAYPVTKLLPTYTPGGPTTGTGATAVPNLSVYAGATSGTATGNSPYPSGVVGTPGPLDNYCGPGTNKAESTPTSAPSRQPAGTTLPFAPAYFPHVVKNASGGLTGYFDERPKTTDESLVVATATATGQHWTYKSQALEQNPGYCPSADVDDDGQGHANVLTLDGKTYLYTLPRAAGDNQGVGMLVHQFTPTTANPTTGLPATEKVGIDPDAFVPTGSSTVTVTHTTARTVPVTTTGTTGSPEQLVTGGFVDLTADPTPTATDAFTCTVTLGATSLTGCETNVAAQTVAVHAGDLVEQVIGYTSKKFTIPKGPNQTIGTGGLKKITVVTTPGGSTKGFTNRLTGTTFNTNAPDRAYVDGVAVYCSQSNTNPATKMTGCTTGPAGADFAAPSGSPILSDPIVPATAYDVASGDGMTSGLVAPDGIVGVLPGYPGAPATSTIVMYTEKELNYYVAGITPKTTVATTTESTFGSTITFTPGPYFPADMPSTVSTARPVTVSMGDLTTKTVIPVTCTGLSGTATAVHPEKLTGCTYPTGGAGAKYTSSSWIGAPGATTVPYATLKLTGEGKTTIKKLDKNNQDLSVLRVAYTTTGAKFQTAGLADTGVISGHNTGGSTYNDINNPATNTNPKNSSGTIDLNEYAKPGTADATEMRWVGSAGSIITNPNGTYGLFLSGSWAADGDSDAFNQVFYSQSSTGEKWSVPKLVVSTDYTFSASEKQQATLDNGVDTPLTISAYYQGRAYGPSVVQHTGKLTMVFAGYALPKGSGTAGETVGTGYTTAPQWTIGATAPNLYRNILAVNLATPTATTVTATPSTPVAGEPVTLSATVSVPSDSSVAPTGPVKFTGDGGTLCTATLDGGSPDVASCHYTYTASGSDSVTATYEGTTAFLASTSAALGVTVGSAPVPPATTPGYTMVGADGGVFTFGGAPFEGSLPGLGVQTDDVVGIARTTTGDGYWLVGADGGVFSFGDATYHGSLPALGVHVSDIVALAPTPDGQGYWLVGANGGVYAFGDVGFYGSLQSVGVTKADVVDLVPTSNGQGYWLVGADGGVFSFGDAGFYGSLPGLGVHVTDVVGAVPLAAGAGYTMVGADGGVFSFGDAAYQGSLPALGVHVTDVVGLAD